MLRNYLNSNINETELELINSIDEFIKIDNKDKFKNIFEAEERLHIYFFKIINLLYFFY
jgi:hypothetical protein